MTQSVPLEELRDRYLDAQLAGNRREAMRLVLDEGLARGVPVIDLQTYVIQAAQEAVGRMWQQNRVTIAQEHMATAISQMALSVLFEHARPGPPLGKKLVLGCVEGEQHDMPARLVADLLELEGFELRYLGANVPHDDLVAIVRQERPDVIGLSVTMSFNLPSLRTAVSLLRATTLAPICIGGHALRWSPGVAAELNVEATGNDPSEVVAIIRRLARVS